MYHGSAHGVDERMINVHFYYERTETQSQAGRQREQRQIGRQADTETDRQAGRHREQRQIGRQADTETDRQTGRHRDR